MALDDCLILVTSAVNAGARLFLVCQKGKSYEGHWLNQELVAQDCHPSRQVTRFISSC